MSEEKPSSIGTMIVVAIAAGLIGYVIGKPAAPQVQAENPDPPEKPAELEEPKEPAFVKEGLVAYYPFNGNAKGGSGNGHDGEVKGATLAEDRHGEAGKAYVFDGRASIQFEPSEKLQTPRATINYWLNATGTTPGMQALVGFPGYQSFIGGTGKLNFGILAGSDPTRGGWMNFETSIKPQGMGWIMVTLIFDGKEQVIFVNGGKRDARVNDATVHFYASVLKLAIGRRNILTEQEERSYPVSYFTGSLDDLRFYDRALGAEEIKALYDLEKPKGK